MKKLFYRTCECGNVVSYKEEWHRDNAIKKGKKCRKCTSSGKNNPMYGRSVYDVWVEKYGKEKADKKYKQYCKNVSRPISDAEKKTLSKKNSGVGNPMYGKSFYDCWVKNYGKDEADKKLKDFKKKRSEGSAGKRNPMYGKPSPQGSGNGWSGWYNEFYFRSILELSYLHYLFENNINFKTAETNEFRIKYKDWKNNERTYVPDFYLIDEDKIIEVKPIKLIDTPSNRLKFQAAKQIYGERFEVLTENDVQRISTHLLQELCDNKTITLLERYEEKLKKNYMHN